VFHDVGSQAVISVWRISCRRSIRLSMSGIRLSTYSNVSIGLLLQDCRGKGNIILTLT
jgi:hypothetical protein